MMKYSTLYRLKIEHEYNINMVCRSFDLKPTSSTVDILRRRGLVFRQAEKNEWCLLGDSNMGTPYTETDKLLFNLYLLDPQFLYYTKWEGFSPNSLYSLSLPTLESHFTEAVNEGANKRKINSEFCLVDIQFNEKLIDNQGSILSNVLKFQAKKVYWEYFFISNGEKSYGLEIELKEENQKILFKYIDVVLVKEQYCWMFKSDKPVQLADYYDYNLSLYNKSTKQKLMDNVPYPVSGQFLNLNIDVIPKSESEADIETIRQVCYF